VRREPLDFSQPGTQPTVEAGYYSSSLSVAERDDAAVTAGQCAGANGSGEWRAFNR